MTAPSPLGARDDLTADGMCPVTTAKDASTVPCLVRDQLQV
jgi:hypothetical protein